MRLLLILLSFSFGAVGFPQQSAADPSRLVPLEFDEQKMEEYKEDAAYDYTEAATQENWWTRFKRYIGMQWQRLMEWIFGAYKAPFLLAVLVDILPYLFLAALIGLILYLFSRLNPGTYLLSSEQGQVNYGEEEKIIKSRDIKQLIEKAVANGNYRLAVRYHFLYMLQQLSRKEFIVYDTSKTDDEYLDELQNEGLKEHFRKLNYIYDFIWYGQFDASAVDYEKIKKEFQKMEYSISK